MRLAFLLILFMGITYSSTAQSMLFNKDGGSPDGSAMLEIRSTEQGFLPPRMTASQRTSISSPAQGLTVFQTDGTVGYYYYTGSAWDTLGGANTTITTNVSNITNVSNSNIAVLRDLKSTGTDGGTFSSGSWQTRDLNDLDGDVSFISLSSDEFTLDSGTYVISANAPAFEVDEHQIRLYSVTNSSIETIGTVAYSDKFAASESTLRAVVSVTASTETFRIEHRCTTTSNTEGFGRAATWGNNVYTQVQVQKL